MLGAVAAEWGWKQVLAEMTRRADKMKALSKLEKSTLISGK